MPPDCYARSARPQPDAAIAEIRMPLPTPARASPPPGRSAPRTPAVSVLILSHYLEPRNATRLPEESIPNGSATCSKNTSSTSRS